MLMLWGWAYCDWDWDHGLELLLCEQVFPVLVLALELVVGTLDGSFLLLKLAYFFFQDFHLLALLHSAADSAFSVL